MSPAGKGSIHRSFALIAATCVALLSAVPLASLEVDRAELEKDGRERIVFINYEGPHASVDSAEDILEIGRALGRAVKAGAVRAGDPKRYFATHSVRTGTAAGGLDADAIGFGVDAGVDHIRNVRLIVRGFLEAAYDYAAADAGLLAEFATVYNAVHRGDWDYYAGRYSAEAAAGFDREKVGLSVRYDEWPGRALIVVPLASAKPGSLSAVDTTPLTEKKVVDELRKKDDLGLDSRKEMVDLKEREADEAKQKAELEREAIVDEEKKIAEEKAALQAERERLAAEREAVERAEKEAADREKAAPGSSGTAEAQAAAEERRRAKEAVEEKEAAVEEKETAVAEKEAAVEEKKEEAAAAERFAEKKEAEADADRRDIAEDQQKVIKKEEDAAAAEPKPTGELNLRMITRDGPYARFVIIELSTGKELKASPLDTVRSRSVAETGGRIVAVAGRSGGNGAVRLITVDPESLELIKQGDDDMHPDSPVWVEGETLYALTTAAAGGVKLGQYDLELKRKALSQASLHPYAALRFADGLILTQDADGEPIALKSGDLTTASK